MSRYAIIAEYDGTAYHGWQIQESVPTIQQHLEEALAQLTQSDIRITGSGRTDTGVHAIGQVAHFDSTIEHFTTETYLRGLNSYLPDDILVKECVKVPANFHARYDAIRRDYTYIIATEPVAIGRQYCWSVYQDLNIQILHRLAEIILGAHDFYSFMSARSSTENTVCTIVKSAWKTGANQLRYSIYGNRFLHNMVRCLVGTMVEVARGRYSLEKFTDFLQAPDKEAPVIRAPAAGLFLEKVHYKSVSLENAGNRFGTIENKR